MGVVWWSATTPQCYYIYIVKEFCVYLREWCGVVECYYPSMLLYLDSKGVLCVSAGVVWCGGLLLPLNVIMFR